MKSVPSPRTKTSSRHRPRVIAPRSGQQGWTLIVSVIFLFILAMLGLAAMQGATLEEKMAGNQRDRNVAFEAAEAALRDAEQDILASGRIVGATGFISDCNSDSNYLGLCLPSSSLTPIWESLDWKDSASPAYYVTYGAKTGASAWPNVVRQPRYIIEWQPNLRGSDLGVDHYGSTPSSKSQYRITAIGYGLTDSSEVRLQSVYRLP